MPTTDHQNEMLDHLALVANAVLDIDGPYAKMKAALNLVADFEGVILDGDEIISGCECCDARLLVDDNYHMTEDGCYICASCCEEADEPLADKPPTNE